MDYGEAFESGEIIGSLRVSPTELLAHFDISVPALGRREPPANALDLWPPSPKAAPGEQTILGQTIAQWRHTLQKFSTADVSYLVDGAREDSYDAVCALLESTEPEVRLVAARLIYFAEPSRLAAVLHAHARELDPRIRGALAEAEVSLRERQAR